MGFRLAGLLAACSGVCPHGGRPAVKLMRGSLRYQRALVPLAAAIFTMLVLVATSVVVMAQRESARDVARAALLASEPSPTDLLVVPSDDVWHGEQFQVFWIQPSTNAEPVLPLGVRRLPEVGEAFVSPELDRLASQDPDLAARYPYRSVIGREGVSEGDELLAYVRMPQEDRTVPQVLSESTPAERVRAFGPLGDDDLGFSLSFPSILTPSFVALGAVGLLVVPGLVVLVTGLTAASGYLLRVARRNGPHGSGSYHRFAFQGFILALPGIIAAVALWALAVSRLVRIPLSERAVLPGDLVLPWWLVVADLCICATMTVLVSILIVAVRRRRGGAEKHEPTPRRDISTAATATTAGVALAILMLAGFLGTGIGEPLLLVGIVAAVISSLLLVPSALRELGTEIGRLSSAPVAVVGKALKKHPLRAARPFFGVTVLSILGLSASGYLMLVGQVQTPPPTTAGAQTVLVDWLEPEPADPARLADALGRGGWYCRSARRATAARMATAARRATAAVALPTRTPHW